MASGKYERKQHNLTCNVCEKEFTSTRSTSKTCRNCQKNPRNKIRKYKECICNVCSTTYTARSDHKSKYCSKICAGKAIMVDKKTNCQGCGVTFEYHRKGQKFCSKKCADTAKEYKVTVNCKICYGDIVKIPSSVSENNFCSESCRKLWLSTKTGDNSSQWRGGVWITPDGYLFIRQEDGTYRGEHRLVMEKSIGRLLLSSEIVHHIDENKLNNDISNLLLVSRSEHIDIHREGINKSKALLCQTMKHNETKEVI